MMLIKSIVDALRNQPVLQRSVLAARTVHARTVERRLNIDTMPDPALMRPSLPPLDGAMNDRVAEPRFDDAVDYETLAYRMLWRTLRPLDLTSDDVVYDIGCGMGRIVCVAARAGVKRCVGIELCPQWAEQAMRNARTLRSPKAPIEIRVGDAAQADYSHGTVYCLFNPFGRGTLTAVMDRIGESIATQSRAKPIRIAYTNPKHADVLDGCPWLERYYMDEPLLYRCQTTYWRTRTAGPEPREPAPVMA
jgi:SAM-dependent methyltransferase